MAHNIETMAYAGALPWHGLGVKVDHDLTPEEMMKAAGLDWTVSARKVAVMDQDSHYRLKTDSIRALVRDSDQTVLGPCGSRFVPVQNQEVFSFFKEFTDAGGMEMHTAGSLKDGRHVWALASIKKGFTLAGGDEVHGFMLLSSPHIWGESMRAMFTSVRVVCNNTLSLALNGSGGFRLPHLREFDEDVQLEAKEALGLAERNFEELEQISQKLSKAKYTEAQKDEFIARVFQPVLLEDKVGEGLVKVVVDNEEKQVAMADMFSRTSKKIRELVETQPGAELASSKGTFWGLTNAVTYFADHEAGRDRDSALESAWFGQRAKLKAKAVETALEMAA